MKILVLNCGSSSVKYKLFDMESNTILGQGGVEKIGMRDSFLKHTRADSRKVILEGEVLTHQNAIEYILGVLTSEKHGAIRSMHEIDAVGHRIVHGGEKFNKSMLLDDEVIHNIEECIEIAPLHNPPNLAGINAIRELLPNVKQVVVFDTAFHQTMPPHAYMYGIPYSLYTKYGIRRYGFHGTSHRYVLHRACELLHIDVNNSKLLTCHIGNGGSIAAIKNGQSIDTSMGFTPVEGLLMGTRSGDIDLGVVTFLMDKEMLGTDSASTLFNKHSGVLGISGVSSDMRDVQQAADEGNEHAQLALKMYQYRIKKYIGAYIAVLNGVDAIVFTGGVGENNDRIRQQVCENMEYVGIHIDFELNRTVHGEEKVISAPDSRIKVIVVPTDEEFMIAKDTMNIIL